MRLTLNCIQLSQDVECLLCSYCTFLWLFILKSGKIGGKWQSSFSTPTFQFCLLERLHSHNSLDFPLLDTLHLSMALLLISCCCIVLLLVFLYSIHGFYCGTMFDPFLVDVNECEHVNGSLL